MAFPSFALRSFVRRPTHGAWLLAMLSGVTLAHATTPEENSSAAKTVVSPSSAVRVAQLEHRVAQLEHRVAQLVSLLAARQDQETTRELTDAQCVPQVFVDRHGIRRIDRHCLSVAPEVARPIQSTATPASEVTRPLPVASEADAATEVPQVSSCAAKIAGSDGVFRVRSECVTATSISCDQPWREDASGMRHVKSGCLLAN